MIIIIAADPADLLCGAAGSSIAGYESQCETMINSWIWVFWAIYALSVVPLQWLVVSIFRAYRDELNDEGKENQINEPML